MFIAVAVGRPAHSNIITAIGQWEGNIVLACSHFKDSKDLWQNLWLGIGTFHEMSLSLFSSSKHEPLNGYKLKYMIPNIILLPSLHLPHFKFSGLHVVVTDPDSSSVGTEDTLNGRGRQKLFLTQSPRLSTSEFDQSEHLTPTRWDKLIHVVILICTHLYLVIL